MFSVRFVEGCGLRKRYLYTTMWGIVILIAFIGNVVYVDGI